MLLLKSIERLSRPMLDWIESLTPHKSEVGMVVACKPNTQEAEDGQSKLARPSGTGELLRFRHRK